MNQVNYFGRTYSLKFFDENDELLIEIFEDSRNEYRGLNLEFEIRQQMFLMNQVAAISIYNLQEKTKEKILRAKRVVLSGGYQTNSGIIYTGNIINIFNLRMQPDYSFKLFCLDYTNVKKPFNLITETTDNILSVIKKIISFYPDLSAQEKNIVNVSSANIGHKIVFNGMNYVSAFEKLGIQTQTRIWVTNSEVFATPEKESSFSDNLPITEIDFQHGLIGSPMFDIANNGINLTTLLNHQLIPGNLIKIKTLNPEIQIGNANYVNFSQSSLNRGTWRILTVNHRGSSRKQEWYSNIQSYTFAPLGNNIL